ncbi:MAG: uncharacterized protein PWQ96_996 [Clostridia bacterium]|nr:uncharacterized protein [Clostridia bacterium]
MLPLNLQGIILLWGDRLERLNIILQSAIYKNIVAEITEYEKDREFCRHTMQHFVDTARICYILILEDTMKAAHSDGKRSIFTKEVIYAAGMLHDIGRLEQYQTGADHAVKGAEIAGDMLSKAHFSPGEIELITTAIREHRRLPENPTYLGERLYKADKLSRPCYGCSVIDECRKKDLAKEFQDLKY